jgi:hypothetical protein
MSIFSESEQLKECKAKCKTEDDAREAEKPQEPGIFSKITSWFSPAQSTPQTGGKRSRKMRKTQRGGFTDNSSKFGSDAAPYNATGGRRRKSRKNKKHRKSTKKGRK